MSDTMTKFASVWGKKNKPRLALPGSAQQWYMFSGATSTSLAYRVKINPTVILRQLTYPGSPLCIDIKREGKSKCPKMTENTLSAVLQATNPTACPSSR